MTTYHRPEDIGLAVQALLTTITISNGFETDSGVRVYLGRRQIDENVVPCVTLVEAEDSVNDELEERQWPEKHAFVRQRYVVQAHGVCDPDHPNTAAHAMIRDMKKVIFGSPVFKQKFKSVRYRGKDIFPRDAGVAIVQANIEFEVTFVENLGA